eukprot:CAMPEP_0180051136 /NCGR_PEP_ID=MMETSP0985-20121206/998_1 /TAXON_ID=483367 /ORGANISM="non described non described, Strain CCMP 2436" /LENGTH=74 /DNA_ID=CAMNT_0021980373 /DNA_START=308 /DNA_END=532 /DNA_ORIENTATION=-
MSARFAAGANADGSRRSPVPASATVASSNSGVHSSDGNGGWASRCAGHARSFAPRVPRDAQAWLAPGCEGPRAE